MLPNRNTPSNTYIFTRIYEKNDKKKKNGINTFETILPIGNTVQVELIKTSIRRNRLMR